MKVTVIQPYYSFDPADTDRCYRGMVDLLDTCDETSDLIVLPEYADVPAAQNSKEDFHASIARYNADILDRAVEAAKRCHAIVCVNAAHGTESGYRNTTHVIDREGNVVGRYYKAHPAPSEVKTAKEGGNELDVGYSYAFSEPYTVEVEGLRLGFMTCYDFYFYESFAPLALKGVDLIIGCSHQRTDPHATLETIHRFLSYHTNAYLVRASVSLGEDSPICGCSTVVAPDGTVLLDMKSRIGTGSVEIDPKKKYYKAAGFRGKEKSHYAYIEEGRRPWLYRNGGASVLPFDAVMSYPRLCAHRGYHTAAPENTMPAFGAAVALGAEEMEFDLWATTDGALVTAHDSKLERVSNGTGRVREHTLAELKALDFSGRFGEIYRDLRIPTFEEILRKFAGRVVMNIHVKIWDSDLADRHVEQIAALVEKYDCAKHVYFMSTNTDALLEMRERLPAAGYCQGCGKGSEAMVEAAIRHGLDKVQFVAWHSFDREMVERCHAHGIRCNFCQANDARTAKEIFDLGVDCVMTDDFQRVKAGLEALGVFTATAEKN